MNCPACGGAMWDNRVTKRNPKSPDFKCQNRSCGKAVWEQPRQANGGGNGQATPSAPRSARALGPLYSESLAFAKAACEHYFGNSVEPDVVVAAAATVFIQAVKDGAPIRAPKAKPAPPPPPPQDNPFEGEVDDLPF